jgi:hypothetical protein
MVRERILDRSCLTTGANEIFHVLSFTFPAVLTEACCALPARCPPKIVGSDSLAPRESHVVGVTKSLTSWTRCNCSSQAAQSQQCASNNPCRSGLEVTVGVRRARLSVLCRRQWSSVRPACLAAGHCFLEETIVLHFIVSHVDFATSNRFCFIGVFVIASVVRACLRTKCASVHVALTSHGSYQKLYRKSRKLSRRFFTPFLRSIAILIDEEL